MALVARAFLLGVLLLALTALPKLAAAKSILVFGPHPDDETIIAGGTVREARAAGHSVTIVVVTNGDFHGVESGLARQGDSVAALAMVDYVVIAGEEADFEAVLIAAGNEILRTETGDAQRTRQLIEHVHQRQLQQAP